MNALNNMGFKRPDVIVIDLRQIFVRYSPSVSVESYMYRENPLLRKFVEQFTVHRMIEAGFVLNYDSLEQENVLWGFIENLYPEGLGEFERDINNYDWLQILYEAMIEEVDELLRRKTSEQGIGAFYQDYLFDRWITHSAASFVHRDYRLPGT